MVGGLNPAVTFDQVLAIFAAVHEAYPHIHIHALSPMEIEWYSGRAGLSVRRTFEKLLEAGYGSLCGTAAEILVDEVRREICPAKLSTARWVEIVRTAHDLGIRSTVDDPLRPHRAARARGPAPGRPARPPAGHRRHHRVHPPALRAVPHAAGPRPRHPRNGRQGRGVPPLRRGAAVFRAADRERAGLVGQTGPGGRGREFPLRRQRSGGHAAGREHHPHRRRPPRRIAHAARDGLPPSAPPAAPRSGATRYTTTWKRPPRSSRDEGRSRGTSARRSAAGRPCSRWGGPRSQGPARPPAPPGSTRPPRDRPACRRRGDPANRR